MATQPTTESDRSDTGPASLVETGVRVVEPTYTGLFDYYTEFEFSEVH